MGAPLRSDLRLSEIEESMILLERLIHSLRAKVRTLFHRRRLDAELDEELQFHIEKETQRRLEAGASPSEARREALREFGGVEQRKEECRDLRGLGLLQDLTRDIV